MKKKNPQLFIASSLESWRGTGYRYARSKERYQIHRSLSFLTKETGWAPHHAQQKLSLPLLGEQLGQGREWVQTKCV